MRGAHGVVGILLVVVTTCGFDMLLGDPLEVAPLCGAGNLLVARAAEAALPVKSNVVSAVTFERHFGFCDLIFYMFIIKQFQFTNKIE